MRVLIIGAGFGGIGAAIELMRNGHTDVTILEKGDAIGGVWRANTYPGAACDIPSVLYSYSFEPNPHWSSRFSGQQEIQDYLKRVADKYDVTRRIRFGVEVTAASFEADRGVWVVTTRDGEVLEAEVFVPALGQLSRPTTPRIKGADTFEGPHFHSAEWRHDIPLRGKRVAIIGTGASAIQIVPNIQPEVGHLTLFQRSAPHISPKPERVYSKLHHAMFEKVPATQGAERLLWWLFMEYNTIGLAQSRAVTKTLAWIPALHRRSIKDPVLRAQMTPTEPVGAKRALFASNYYPALEADNATVTTDAIEEITPTGIRTQDGTFHEVDVIVYCTGFTATSFMPNIQVRGLGGKDLHEVWSATGAHAYLGLTVPGFPNLFLMYGPNTNVGAGSIIYMHEGQAGYIRSAVDHLVASGASYVDVRPEVAEAFDDEVQRRMQRTVWLQGESWYRDSHGRVTTNWPARLLEYRRRTKALDPADYEVTVLRDSRVPVGS